jgi:sodium pump decarboxylase gamma subunit
MLMLASQGGDALNPTVSIMIANSLMGILIVFCVLIFISFIISLFKYLPGSGAAKPKPAPAAPKPAAAPKAPAKASENLVNDQELVAVITAAIYAYESSVGGASVSGDPLVVRSIRRAR